MQGLIFFLWICLLCYPWLPPVLNPKSMDHLQLKSCSLVSGYLPSCSQHLSWLLRPQDQASPNLTPSLLCVQDSPGLMANKHWSLSSPDFHPLVFTACNQSQEQELPRNEHTHSQKDQSKALLESVCLLASSVPGTQFEQVTYSWRMAAYVAWVILGEPQQVDPTQQFFSLDKSQWPNSFLWFLR